MANTALLIPVYNDLEGLRHSLHRLSDEVPLDIVVVDDGSDPPIASQLFCPPHRIFSLRLSKNQGIAHALNHGLEWILNRGYKYIARLDAGDVALPGRFREQIAFLENHPDYALIGGQVRFVDFADRLVYSEHYPIHYRDIRRHMHLRNVFIHPTVMMRASALLEHGLYRTDIPAAEDYELFFRLIQHYPAANSSRELVHVRLSPGGISSRYRYLQLLSRLRIQLAYFDVLMPESYFGVLQTLALLGVPRSLRLAIKRFLGKR